ncbi:MAG: hypothetical protein U0441_06655 [Polyangiaceae bacterium]
MSQERLASLAILACVARAEGKVRPTERLALEALAQSQRDFSLQKALHETADLEALLPLVVSPELRHRTLVEAIALANIDGRCSPEELTILTKIRDAFGASTEIDLIADSDVWKRKTERIRKALQAATAAYLHKVHDDAEHVQLSMDRYEHLVAELTRTKLEIERAFRDAME